MKKFFIAIVVLAVLGAGAYYLLKHNQAKAPTEEVNSETKIQNQTNTADNKSSSTAPTGQTTTKNNTSSPDYVPPTSDTGGESPAENIQVVEVDYNGTQFTPAVVNIKVNDWVFFKNKSSVSFWPASNPHPTHTDYPGFDALKAIAPGGEYKFQFTKVGSWGFHDHLNHSVGGTVNVTK